MQAAAVHLQHASLRGTQARAAQIMSVKSCKYRMLLDVLIVTQQAESYPVKDRDRVEALYYVSMVEYLDG